MLLNGIYERRTVSTTTRNSNAAVFTLVPVLPLMFTASNGNATSSNFLYLFLQQRATYWNILEHFQKHSTATKKFLVVPSVDTYLKISA
jgi:hypothetical protein